ncbi:MAG: 4a-hydroxytetrahydrobiopterin dehydratase [Alphaproteobacteria bacterium]
MSWREEGNSLVCEWEFANFEEAWEFACKAVEVFGVQEHHAALTVQWGLVTIVCSTQDAGNIVTEKDWALADALDEIE